MTLKTVKNIKEEKWAEIKSIAAKQKVQIGKVIENMVDAYEKHNEEVWNLILHGDKNLSDEEATDMKKISKSLRKEKWFRNDFNF